MQTIKIKYLRDIDPVPLFPWGDWIDLRAGERVCLKAGEYAMIPLGVAIQLPVGYEAIVAPRSSTFKKFGIIVSNSIGLIDESYCGDNDQWYFSAVALRDTRIEKNDRICQFRIVKKMPDVTLETVDFLTSPDRGGIGSTGEK